MKTKQEIIDSLIKGGSSGNSQFISVKRSDLLIALGAQEVSESVITDVQGQQKSELDDSDKPGSGKASKK